MRRRVRDVNKEGIITLRGVFYHINSVVTDSVGEIEAISVNGY